MLKSRSRYVCKNVTKKINVFVKLYTMGYGFIIFSFTKMDFPFWFFFPLIQFSSFFFYHCYIILCRAAKLLLGILYVCIKCFEGVVYVSEYVLSTYMYNVYKYLSTYCLCVCTYMYVRGLRYGIFIDFK